MPDITVEGPIIKEIDKKRNLVSALTDAAVEVYELAKNAIVVLIKENALENVGVGGKLIVKREAESAA